MPDKHYSKGAALPAVTLILNWNKILAFKI